MNSFCSIVHERRDIYFIIVFFIFKYKVSETYFNFLINWNRINELEVLREL